METRPAGEDDEPVVYVFAGRGRRGVDSLVSLQPRIPRLQPNEKVMECRRRRYRTRTGRYAMEFEVQRLGSDLISGSDMLWISQRDYEELWREGRIKSQQEENDGGSAEDNADVT
ncbi:unnamed protein product [Phytophthora fragariaefolia]|uniref:Unnamed protein product n=1 Tax=Phytophthora fragariaefolia TaxID=1490495 RepID=A0A9W6YDY9_9STRA|nr:unnamed protein product [Phytophthora fragariaefolia]